MKKGIFFALLFGALFLLFLSMLVFYSDTWADRERKDAENLRLSKFAWLHPYHRALIRQLADSPPCIPWVVERVVSSAAVRPGRTSAREPGKQCSRQYCDTLLQPVSGRTLAALGSA